MIQTLKNNIKEIIIGVLIISIIVLSYFLVTTLRSVNETTRPFDDAKELLDERLKQSEERIETIQLERDKLLREKKHLNRELVKLVEDARDSNEKIKLLKKEIDQLNIKDEEDITPNSLRVFINDKLLGKGSGI